MLGKLRARSLLVRSGLLVTATELWLRRTGFQLCHSGLRRIARLAPFRWKPRPDPALAQQIADIVDRSIVATSIYPARCLTRAMVLDYFLHRYGQDSELKLGVRTITGKFEAHAWIESQGAELNEPEPASDLYQSFSLSPRDLGRNTG